MHSWIILLSLAISLILIFIISLVKVNVAGPRQAPVWGCCPTAGSGWLHPLPPACSESRWLPLHLPSLPFLEQSSSRSLSSRSSPDQYASTPLDALQFPCLLRSWRAQRQPGAASPLPRRGDTHYLLCPALHGDIFS